MPAHVMDQAVLHKIRITADAQADMGSIRDSAVADDIAISGQTCFDSLFVRGVPYVARVVWKIQAATIYDYILAFLEIK